MTIQFKVIGLPLAPFKNLFALPSSELAKHHARLIEVDECPGYPCRVSLKDAQIGEKVIATTYIHHDVDSPYRASGPIFIRENAIEAQLKPNEVPTMLLHRLLSIRGYDGAAKMIAAEVTEGSRLTECIENLFINPDVKYLHVHNAKPGCFNCTILRWES